MKQLKYLSNFTLVIAVLLLSINSLYAKENIYKSEKTTKISNQSTFLFKSINSNVDIQIWSRNEIKIETQLTVRKGDESDIKKLNDAINRVSFENNSQLTEFNTSIITSSVMKSKKSTIKLITGETIPLKREDFTMSYKVWVPENLSLNISHKYGKLIISSITGDMKLDIYNSTVEAGDFGSRGDIVAKYSKISTGNGGDIKMDIYNTIVKSGKLGNIKVISKYSNLTMNGVKSIDIDSYNDTYIIGNKNITSAISKMNLSAKYSSFEFNQGVKSSYVDIYNTKLKGSDLGDLKIDSKYSTIKINSANTYIGTSYNNTYEFEFINSLKCSDSKYDSFRIKYAEEKINFETAFQTKIEASESGRDFEGLSGDFKYGSIKLKLQPATHIYIKATTTYGKLQLPSIAMYTTKNDTSNTKHHYEAYSKEDAKCRFILAGYSTDITISY